MRKPYWHVRPASLAVIGALTAVLMVVTALVETRNTRETLLSLVEEKGRIAARQIEQGAVLALRATEEAEAAQATRLLTVAETTARLEAFEPLEHRALAELARAHAAHAIHLVSPDGRLEASSQPAAHFRDRTPPDFREVFPGLFAGAERTSVLGLHPSAADGTPRFAVGARRPGGGIVVVSMDPARLLEVRKTFGLGRLIQDVGSVHGIRYVMIQDRDGILSATPNISGARRVLEDPFLARLWQEGGEASRSISFDGNEALEIVKAIDTPEQRLGLLRVAFDLHELRALEQKSRRRLWTTILVLGVLGIVALNAVVIYQNMRLVVRARDQVSTFSGAVLSGMADGVMVFSGDGSVSLANGVAQDLFGTRRDRAPAEIASLVAETLQREAPVVEQREITDPQGRERFVTLSASRVRVPGDPAPYAVVILRDDTEERRLRASVQRSEKITAMGRLAAAVAHEVRNPLNAIGMTAQRLRAEFEPREDAEAYHRFLDVIRSEIARLDDIITQFLRFASEPRIEPREEDLAELARSVATQAAGWAAERGVRFTLDVPEGLTAVLDPRQVRQVLLNLVNNAIESMRDGGEVRISAGTGESGVEIRVEDDGPGIAPEALEQAFDLHFTTKEKGTGLGLPISQKIMERHGGFLDLENREGGGTRAILHFSRGGPRT